MRWGIAHPWWSSNPQSLDYIPSFINSRYVSDHQSNTYQMYFYISGAPNQEIVHENDRKYELKMFGDGHFEFYNLLENGVINSLAYGRNGFSTKNNKTKTFRNDKWSTFPKKEAYMSSFRVIFHFCPDYLKHFHRIPRSN